MVDKNMNGEIDLKVETLKKLVNDALEDLKAIDVTTLDVRDKTSVTDWIVIATGSSNRHVRSLANSVVTAAKGNNRPVLGVEGENEGEWVLVDLGDVIVHLMQPQVRDFYDLESLWSVDTIRRKEAARD
jgi:ribosome-associated protein